MIIWVRFELFQVTLIDCTALLPYDTPCGFGFGLSLTQGLSPKLFSILRDLHMLGLNVLYWLLYYTFEIWKEHTSGQKKQNQRTIYKVTSKNIMENLAKDRKLRMLYQCCLITSLRVQSMLNIYEKVNVKITDYFGPKVRHKFTCTPPDSYCLVLNMLIPNWSYLNGII